MFYFAKMQASGNDFVIVNNLDNKITYSYKLLSKFLCDRHYGVGADGVIFLEQGKNEAFRMRIFNRDSSEAEMCGNGIRCLAKYIYDNGLVDVKEFKVETLAGVKKLEIKVGNDTVYKVLVDMGKPIWNFSEIPVFLKDCMNEESIKIQEMELYPVSFGNPHAVCFVNDIEKINIEKYGRLIENYKCFPNRTNVEFVKIESSSKIKIRVWERGVGETFSCGTGICAAACASIKFKSTKNDLIVETKGGNLKVLYGETVKLIGGAEMVFEGKLNI